MNMKKLINKLASKAKPFFADYRVTVYSAIGSREVKHTHFAWTQTEALEWCSLQCDGDLCIISSSWFGFRVAVATQDEVTHYMKVGI